MNALKIVLLVCQMISCVALTLIVMLQNGKDDGLGAIAGNSENYFGKGKGTSREEKMVRLTKWIAAAFVLLTLFVSLLYTAA